MISLETANLGEMIDNIIYYSDIVSSREDERADTETGKKRGNLTDKGQRFFRTLIMIMLVVTMLTTIFLNSYLYISSASSKMLEEAGEYSYQINNWVTEQESIMNMFVNSISANPEMLNDYDGMVKYLDEITRHYPGISATYIANPEFTHGHPMIMNNGWVPAEDYVEEERNGISTLLPQMITISPSLITTRAPANTALHFPRLFIPTAANNFSAYSRWISTLMCLRIFSAVIRRRTVTPFSWTRTDRL